MHVMKRIRHILSAGSAMGMVACAVLWVAGATSVAQAAKRTDVVVSAPRELAPYPFALVAVGQQDGTDTAIIQLRLNDLGFWVQNVDGKFDLTTKQAVMAYQKYVGITATGRVDAKTAAALAMAQFPAAGKASRGDVVQVDKKKQLAFVMREGITVMALNVSTGNDKPYEKPDANTPGVMIKGVAITREGKFNVQRRRSDGWWYGDMGPIYRPIYFDGGIAFHGSAVIPAYPASHGCIRVSVPAMDMLWEIGVLEFDARVWVY
jgi:lipoprotein-anchoring transpeptidase ErfK/SrfK